MTAPSQHPDYASMHEAWALARVSYLGELAVKQAGTEYLPPTSGHREDGVGQAGTDGQADYDAYRKRSLYPDLYRESVRDLVGTMHEKPPTIELPPAMERLRERATSQGESLEMLLRRINVAQLTSGRIGLLGDLRLFNGDAVPLISTYAAPAVLDWDTDTKDDVVDRLWYAVLDESGHERGVDFKWEQVNRYRLIAMTNDGQIDPLGRSYATAELVDGQSVRSAEFIAPDRRGITLPTVPFAFVNANNINSSPEMPPLLGLALLCMAIYRGEADYRHNLFWSGQDTLVTVGDTDDGKLRIGSGARINIPSPDGDAKFIGVSAAGLGEQRTALENDYTRAAQRGGQLIDAGSKAKESGDALRLRIAAQTTGLQLVATAGAAGLQHVLRAMAPWFNVEPESINVLPNTDFTSDVLDGANLVQLQTAVGLGAPFSERTVHQFGRENGATRMDYEEEMEQIRIERAARPPELLDED